MLLDSSFSFTGAAMVILVLASFGQESFAFVQKQRTTVKAGASSWQQKLLARVTARKGSHPTPD